MKAFLYSLVVAFGFVVSFVDGQCSICPDGVDEGFLDEDPTGDGSNTCAEIDILYGGLDPFSCLSQKPAIMPNCCPSQLNFYAADNVCGWCPNGVEDVYMPVPDLLFGSDTTCLNYMELVSFTEDSEGCNFFDQAALICCPADAGPVFTCDFCAQGLEFPDYDPANDGSNCTSLQALVGLVPDQDSCNFFKSLELSCCPSSTDLKSCDFCSQGLDNPDIAPFPDGSTCTDLKNNATLIADGELCDLFKGGEAFCCPTTTDREVCDFCGGSVLPDQNLGFDLSEFGLGGEDVTCEDLAVYALLIQNETDCGLITSSFEGICCPDNQDPVNPPTPPTSPPILALPPVTTSPPISTPPPVMVTSPPVSTPPPPTTPASPQNPTPSPVSDTAAASDSSSIGSIVKASILCAFTALVSF